ncbi:hypothetical protein Pmani_012035 [Petrolisthes manimaculis]|uniref:Uncharacterized protein n=2 Tax=Petrolisthes manimaculis TaxID=1843537 RepID=A0AAE1UFH8_9EUCA|nr:hypothetical protein Pmani_012035 [Petrolisthes manimaculis]
MAHTTEMEYLRRLRGTARGKVTRKCQLLNEQVRQGKPSNIIEIYYEEVKEAFTELERRHETLVNRICEGEEKDEEFQVKLDEEDQYIAQCLSGEALSLVHGVEDDFDEMFRRLDQRYADPIKLTDCVIDQLKKLKPQKREWTKKYQNLSNKVNAFPELMKYLKEERELLDYMDTEVRNNTRSTKTAFHSLEAKEDSNVTDTISTKLYKVPLTDEMGNMHLIQCLGMDEITSEVNPVHLGEVIHVLNVSPSLEISRPHGKVDVLIGADNCNIIPITIKTVGNLQLMKGPFGYCVRGSHSGLKVKGTGYYTAQINHISLKTELDEMRGETYKTVKEELDTFLTMDHLGIKCKPRCSNCRECHNCSRETNMTMKEEEEMKLILNGLEYKEREKVWIAHYPWIKDPHQLPNNFGVAMMKLKGTEKRLRKLGGIRSAEYSEQMINIFRENPVAIIGDISKMFNSVRLSEFDSHVHRFLWRDFEDRAPDHYALTAVPFGDICSPAIAVLAMRQTADKYKDDFPIPANIILKDSYMDDIIHSLDDAEETPETMQDVEFILKQGNFHMKEWIVSGRTQAEEVVDLSGTTSEKVLGVVWNPKEDEISYKIKLNITPKQKTSVPCTVTGTDGSDRELPNDLTKRRVLSKISTIFDPLGLVTPVTLCGKLLLRQIILYTCDKDRKLDWDDPLPKELGENWYKFLQNITRLETLKIPRCIRTTELVKPTLIMFNDASTLAYSACAYARWQVGSGKYIARLLASKSRLAPIKIQTVPRLELASAVLSARLRNTIVEESNIKYDYIYHLTDSEIVLAQIMKDNLNVGTYVANRVSEIRETTSKEEWHWISTEVNIADLMTRPNLQVNIDAGSYWQRGPDFLGLPTTEWPIKAIPLNTEEKTIISTVGISKVCIKQCSLFDIDKFRSYRKLIRVTARLISAFRERSLKGISLSLTGEQLKEAETLWIKCMQVPLQDNWQVRFKRLGPFCKDGILYVGSRIATWMKSNYNNEAFILLPTTHKLTDLCIKDVHDRDHGGVDSTLCKLQAKFWIPQARKLIKATKSRCVTCR